MIAAAAAVGVGVVAPWIPSSCSYCCTCIHRRAVAGSCMAWEREPWRRSEMAAGRERLRAWAGACSLCASCSQVDQKVPTYADCRMLTTRMWALVAALELPWKMMKKMGCSCRMWPVLADSMGTAAAACHTSAAEAETAVGPPDAVGIAAAADTAVAGSVVARWADSMIAAAAVAERKCFPSTAFAASRTTTLRNCFPRSSQRLQQWQSYWERDVAGR